MNTRQGHLLFVATVVVGVLAILPSASGAALTFGPGNGLDAGTNPSSIANGDLDGDGEVDLVVANFGSNSVSLFTGRGDGRFSPARNYPVGVSPRGIEVGDFDGDGSIDVVTANANSNDVSLLLNSGSGTLGPAISLATGIAPFSVSRGDLNGDTRPDLVAANFQTSTVSVMINTGNANFAAQETFAMGSGPFSVRVVDLNNDGRPDLATADSLADTVSVRLNSTGPTGTPVTFGDVATFATGDGPFAITGSDFNYDGRPDLATANSESDTVSILLGIGNGAFGGPIPFPGGADPYDLTPGDFDGDRIADLAVANFGSGLVTVLPGLGNGSFGNGLAFEAGNGPFGIVAADFNNDRMPDLSTADLNSGRASVLINSPTAVLTKQTLDFGSSKPVPRGTVTAPLVTRVTNGGSAPLRIEGLFLDGSASNDYLVEGDTCIVDVQPGESCRIRVRFAPADSGDRRATLEVRTNALSDPTVGLSGRAGPFPRAKVKCKLTKRRSRNPKVRCTVAYPVSTLVPRTRWTLSRSGEVVRRGILGSTGPTAILRLRGFGSLPGGRYVLRVDGAHAGSFEIRGS